MKKEDIFLIGQLLASMREASDRLEEAINSKDREKINNAKKAIISFQEEINNIK
jgi:hypothetical protein